MSEVKAEWKDGRLYIDGEPLPAIFRASGTGQGSRIVLERLTLGRQDRLWIPISILGVAVIVLGLVTIRLHSQVQQAVTVLQRPCAESTAIVKEEE